jgi:hypothetical protein
VLVAAVINMVVGALWYSQLLFAKPWIKLTGRKNMDDGAGISYAMTTVAALVQTFVLAVLMVSLNITNGWTGVCLGLMVWVGFAVTTSLSDYLFSGRSLKLWALNQGYYLVVLAINGALLASWR